MIMKLGFTLYNFHSVIDSLEDLDNVLAKLENMGVDTVQVSGIGYLNNYDVAKLCKKHGMKVCLTHLSFDRIVNDTDAVTEEHKALGCKVIYNRPYSKQYVAGGDKSLVDGLRGGWTYGDKKWQGFIGKDYCLDVTHDLGSVQNLSSVSVDFMQAYGAWVFFPENFKVSISNDGKNFNEVYSTTSTVDKSIQSGYRTLAWKGHSKARYVRVQGNTTMDGGWLFIDEIVVK